MCMCIYIYIYIYKYIYIYIYISQGSPEKQNRRYIEIDGQREIIDKYMIDKYISVLIYTHNMNTYTGSQCKMYFLLKIEVIKQKG